MNTLTEHEEVEAEIYIHARPPGKYSDEDMSRGYGICLQTSAYECVDGYILIGTQKVMIEVPSGVNVVNGMVEGLRNKQQKIRAKAEVDANEIEVQIQNMLCLEHQT